MATNTDTTTHNRFWHHAPEPRDLNREYHFLGDDDRIGHPQIFEGVYFTGQSIVECNRQAIAHARELLAEWGCEWVLVESADSGQEVGRVRG